MTDPKPMTLRDLLKSLFPLPDQASLLREIDTQGSIPFSHFGMTGGYGQTRSELVSAIQLSDWGYAESLYYSLIEDGLTDQLAENLCDGGSTDIEQLARDLASAIQEANDTHFKQTGEVV